jgi:arabinofuranan 3-O-arabinosyltransferase
MKTGSRPEAAQDSPPASLHTPAWLPAEAVAYAALGALVVLAVFLNRWGSFTPDTEPQLYLAPGRVLMQSLFSWKVSPALGQANFQTGAAPVAALIFAIRALGASAWVAVRVWRALLLLLAAWGAVRFFRHVAGGRDAPAGRVAAALLYVANPYVLVSGASTPVLLPYALFPWMMLAFARSVDEPRSWRWPAAFALVFFLMGGLNAGIVPLFLLLGVPAYLMYARLAEGKPLRQLAAPLLKGGVLLGLASAYWIVPAIGARGTASTIAVTTERPADVASTSSYAETLRLLGLWPLYGRQGALPFLPNAVGYVTNPLVVVATFAIPVAAAVGAFLSRARGRLLGALLLAIGAPVMVGLFPPQSPTPFGRALSSFFDHVPGGIGFRTTNKSGALVVLALVLLIALGAVAVAGRLRAWGRPGVAVLAGTIVLVLLLSVFPAWSGRLYGPASTDVPSYWQQAARTLNGGSPNTRVLFLPGEEFADYRWGKRGPTDLNDSLLSRPSALRVTVPNGSAYAANFLAALDVPINNHTYRTHTIPMMARYLGARDVLVRNDLTWEVWGGARPSAVAAIMSSESGLRLAASFGSPGEFTAPPGRPASDEPAQKDAQLPPLQDFVVAAPRPVVRAEPVARTVLLDGDNFGLAPLIPLNLLPGGPAFRFLGAMTSSDLEAALRDPGVHIVLTDSNRRRAWNFRRTGVDYSATLGPDESFHSDGDLSFGLFGDDPTTQTVALLSGARSVTATGYGSVFGAIPWEQPAFAFDGNRHSAWLAGGLGGAIGQAVTIQFDHPRRVSRVTLRPVLGGHRQIATVQIRAGSATTSVDLPAGQGRLVADLPNPTRASSLTVTVTGIRGSGVNAVGFWGIDVPGVRVRTFARLPLSFDRAARGLDAAGRAALARTPLDVVMVREAGSAATPFDDEEPNLDRQFTLPDSRTMTFDGAARLSPTLPDDAVDRVVGLSPGVVATSSSRTAITTRSSAALDGNPATAWIPDGDPLGQYMDVRFPGAMLQEIAVTQGEPFTGRFIASVDLSLNGGLPVRRRLGAGTTVLGFPRQRVHEVRMTITKIGGTGGSVRVKEMHLGGLTVGSAGARTPLSGCVPGFKVDDREVLMRSTGTFGQLAAGLPVAVEPCGGEDLSLGAGAHRITQVLAWQLDELHLSSGKPAASDSEPAPPDAPELEVESSTPTRTVIATRGSDAPYYLVLGQGYDPRWRASMDGTSLGRPILLDGYSVGWIVRAPGPHRFTVAFGPQRWMNASMALSLVALVVIVALLIPRRRRR